MTIGDLNLLGYKLSLVRITVGHLGRRLEEILPKHSPEGISLNASLVSLLTNHSILSLGTRLTSAKEPTQFVDYWGQPLQIAWRDQMTNQNASPRLMLGSEPLIVWSVGPNGKNDYGNQDDVHLGGDKLIRKLDEKHLGGNSPNVQRTGSSRPAQRQIERQGRPLPAAHPDRSV
jgi:hypothetical protein